MSVTPQKRRLVACWTSDGVSSDEQPPSGKRSRMSSEPAPESSVRHEAAPDSLAPPETIARLHSAPPDLPGPPAPGSRPDISRPVPLGPFGLPSLVDAELSAKLGSLPKAKFVRLPFAVDPAHDPEENYYRRPEGHYVRYVEPAEMDLYEMTEYDMDEQDRHWLSILNTERKADGDPDVPEAFFEAVMDKLEKEWFTLMKEIPKRREDVPYPEDIVCNICNDGEAENLNAIVFCDGCNLAVHQDCYGIPYIPEGPWLCRKCMLSPEAPVSCIFCPNEGGAFKQTTTNRWAHLLCAMWIPEVGISNPVYMEPIDQIGKVPKSRWKLYCYLCRTQRGACIQCSHINCYQAFHVTCARKAGLYMMRDAEDGTEQFCDKHGPKDHVIDPVALEIAKAPGEASRRKKMGKAALKRYNTQMESQPAGDEAFGGDQSDGDSDEWHDDGESRRASGKSSKRPARASKARSNKAAQAHQKSYSASSIVAPQWVISSVLLALQRDPVRKKSQVVQRIARYWSLKRASRRGAPLLKRLHLEPWTASSSMSKEDAEARARKLEVLLAIRRDLEKVRMLVELVHKREKAKLREMLVQKECVEFVSEPVTYVLRSTLEEVKKLDNQEYFWEPISAAEVPDYFEVVKDPMDFATMGTKVEGYKYGSVAEMKSDLDLICANAMLYNTKDTPYFKAAQKLQQRAAPLFEEAEAKLRSLGFDEDLGVIPMELPESVFELVLPPPPKPPTPPPEFASSEPPETQDDGDSTAPDVPDGDSNASVVLETESAGRSMKRRTVDGEAAAAERRSSRSRRPPETEDRRGSAPPLGGSGDAPLPARVADLRKQRKSEGSRRSEGSRDAGKEPKSAPAGRDRGRKTAAAVAQDGQTGVFSIKAEQSDSTKAQKTSPGKATPATAPPRERSHAKKPAPAANERTSSAADLDPTERVSNAVAAIMSARDRDGRKAGALSTEASEEGRRKRLTMKEVFGVALPVAAWKDVVDLESAKALQPFLPA
ncbi:hypothetical protein DFJ74DRAFT_669843 [Hyaloraphidium curvatum]|nr:hypothetical protein DFJ74DRAFT_669843 [Hyaloraphidium curvatum]